MTLVSSADNEADLMMVAMAEGMAPATPEGPGAVWGAIGAAGMQRDVDPVEAAGCSGPATFGLFCWR